MFFWAEMHKLNQALFLLQNYFFFNEFYWFLFMLFFYYFFIITLWDKINEMKYTQLMTYEGCHLYFGIREQKQILIIENRFIVFQNISIVEALLSLWLIDYFERLTNCVGSNANKFFSQSNVHAILNVCWSH